jgi:hypothetical protein
LVAIPAGLIGITTAITIDAAALARDQVPVTDAGKPGFGFALVPAIQLRGRRTTLGLVGTF